MAAKGFLLAAALLGAVIAFGESPAEVRPAEVRPADRMFVSQMIPHHHLGRDLLDRATTEVDDVRVRRLIFEMGGYHRAELHDLERWAEDWGVEVATDHPGRVDPARLDAFSGRDDGSYDREWLRLMIEHHEGAVILATTWGGRASEPVSRLAGELARVQSAEMERMRALLDEL